LRLRLSRNTDAARAEKATTAALLNGLTKRNFCAPLAYHAFMYLA
jgi:hypothetical protein